MDTILKFEKVNKYYGNKVHALKNISLEVREGEMIAVIGPSGSGKSTFLRTINKLISISDGEIILDGQRLSQQQGSDLRAIRRKVGMIFQNYNLVYQLSVLQNVLHGYLGYLGGWKGILGLYPEEEKIRAIELLQELGLGAQCYSRAANLSGGQKQRVGIARAIMQNPKILLADEPIASLDPLSAKTIMDILAALVADRGITCIVNLHQLDVAKRYATRIIGLSQGEIVFDGKPSELTEDVVRKLYGLAEYDEIIGGSGGESQDICCRAS